MLTSKSVKILVQMVSGHLLGAPRSVAFPGSYIYIYIYKIIKNHEKPKEVPKKSRIIDFFFFENKPEK